MCVSLIARCALSAPCLCVGLCVDSGSVRRGSVGRSAPPGPVVRCGVWRMASARSRGRGVPRACTGALLQGGTRHARPRRGGAGAERTGAGTRRDGGHGHAAARQSPRDADADGRGLVGPLVVASPLHHSPPGLSPARHSAPLEPGDGSRRARLCPRRGPGPAAPVRVRSRRTGTERAYRFSNRF